MIKDQDGRTRSVRTPEEDLKLLQDELKTLTKEERETLDLMLSELRSMDEEAVEAMLAGEDDSLMSAVKKVEYKWEPVDMRTFIYDPYYLGATCKNTYPRLYDDLVELFSGGYSEAILTGSITLDALVQESDGGLPTLEERIGQQKDVLVLKESGLESSTTEPGHHSGIKEVVRVTLANGMRLDLTPDHEVQVYRGGVEWIPAGEIGVGERVLTARRIRTTPSSDLSQDEAKLLAYWIADGSSSEYRARFCDGNPATSIEVVALLDKLGFEGVRYEKGPNCWEVHTRETKRSGVVDWLKKYEADRKTAEVLVPSAVCRASDDVVAAFLNRLWACEGTVYCPESEASPPRFALGMISERFIRQIQMLLLRFGVQARIRETDYTDKRNNAERKIWHLTVSGVEPLTRFMAAIGPILGKEEACDRVAAYCSLKKANTNVDVLPLTWGELNDMMVSHGIRRAAGNHWWKLGTARERHLSRAMFDLWLKDYNSTVLGQKLKSRFPEDVGYELVVSNESLLVARPVGDIGAHNGNRFIANGMSVHNSIGWGKTYFASIGVARVLYEISCMRDPHASFGLAKNSDISIVCLSVNEALATKVAFENIATKIKESPYFQDNFPCESTKKELRFPNSIWLAPRSSTDTNVLGLNAIAGLMDETNFMPKTRYQKASHARWGHYDRAESLYSAIKRRMQSRFARRGKLPGIMFIVSSKKTTEDFTAKRIRDGRDDPTVFCRDYATWDVKPGAYFTNGKFWVLCGNEVVLSRIVPEPEVEDAKANLPDGAVMIEVPEDMRGDFERDLEGAIRDQAGIATPAVSPFIQRREKIMSSIDKNRTHPFSVQEYTPGKPGQFMWDKMVRMRKERGIDGIESHRLRPIVSPTAPRHVHIDPSLSGDATGFCLAHIAGWKDVARRSDDGRQFIERAPVYYVDMVLRVVPPNGGEIQLGDVRRLIYELSQHGYMITFVSMDSFQSADSLQQLSQKGYTVGRVSVDTTLDPYENVKTALYEDRINYYEYPKLQQELRQLEKDLVRMKVDHPQGGSKDLADAMCGCIYSLSQRITMSEPLPMMGPVTDSPAVWNDEAQSAGSARYEGMVMPLPFVMGDDWDKGWNPGSL